MTRTLYLLIWLLAVPSALQTANEPMYKLIKSKRDRSLNKNESGLNFHFEDTKGNIIQNDIRMTYNGKSTWLSVDENGHGTYTVKPGPCLLTFFYNEDHYTVKTDTIYMQEGYSVSVDIIFRPSVVMVGRSGRR
ncbi:MAG TPA: hypothetical protein VD905_11690 [Flavobacteriales bacterium]|nr:hypothetical protein [Flavobacteriales bacterium]